MKTFFFLESTCVVSLVLGLGLEHSCAWPRECLSSKGCPWPWPRIFFVSLASSLVSSTPPLLLISPIQTVHFATQRIHSPFKTVTFATQGTYSPLEIVTFATYECNIWHLRHSLLETVTFATRVC